MGWLEFVVINILSLGGPMLLGIGSGISQPIMIFLTSVDPMIMLTYTLEAANIMSQERDNIEDSKTTYPRLMEGIQTFCGKKRSLREMAEHDQSIQLHGWGW